MRSELRCDDVRVELSARMDQEADPRLEAEVDEHLLGCAACRRHEVELRAVKRAVGLQTAPRVPDLTGEIMARVRPPEAPRRRTEVRRVRVRIAAVAAVIAALVVAGSLPFVGERTDVARAGEIVQKVRAAAGELGSYRASFDVVERGWHPRIAVRRFDVDVWFDAPERFRLRVRDRTKLPGTGWPVNDVDLVATPGRWWVREPYSCPTPALPGCSISPGVEERSIVNRQPFDGTTPLPTDIVLPLQTLAGHEGIEVLGQDTVLGRTAHRIVLPYWQAAPLVDSLRAGGTWRSFDAQDPVHVWLDRRTWFPLRFDVRARDGADILFSVVARSFDVASIPRASFQAPAAGAIRDGGFRPAATPDRSLPRYTAGLRPYRSGGTYGAQRVATYVRGMWWLKVVVADDEAPIPSDVATAEIVRLGSSGSAYYRPADRSLRRQLDVVSPRTRVHIETNLPRHELMRVGGSLPMTGRVYRKMRGPGGITTTRTTVERALATRSYAEAPRYLPPGYEPSVAIVTASPSTSEDLTLYYRRPETEYEGAGIRLTQIPRSSSLPPSSEDLSIVRIGRITARWSEERSELEWLDGGVYRAVAVPGFDLSVAARIAASIGTAR